MIINLKTANYKISAKISVADVECAKAYIQGAVHSHCNNAADSPLSVRILFGGDNGDWNGTPLQWIYNYHKYIGKSTDPNKQAAIDVGRLLKIILQEDVRDFQYVGEDSGKKYLFIQK